MDNFKYTDECTKAYESEKASIRRLVERKLTIHEFSDVFIATYAPETVTYHGEVLTNEGNVIIGVNGATDYECHIGKHYPLPSNPEIIEDGIYLGYQNTCWGHCITDAISKLWICNNAHFLELLNKGLKVYLSIEFGNYEGINSLLHLYSVMNVPFKIHILTAPTHFMHVYVPDNSFFIERGMRWYTKEFDYAASWMTESALEHSKSTKKYSKIYLSRERLSHKNAEFGERAIRKLFQSVGYKVIFPEQISFEDQVYMLNNATTICATMGSLSHNFIFCSPKTQVCILRKAFYTNEYQHCINQLKNLDVEYIDCHLSIFTDVEPNLGPFFIYINQNVVKYFQDKFQKCVKENFNKKCYMRYIDICLRRPKMKYRTTCPEIYFNKVSYLLSKPSKLKLLYRFRKIKFYTDIF